MAQLEAIDPRLNAVIESFEGEAKEAIDTDVRGLVVCLCC
jgi:hypothetical protein